MISSFKPCFLNGEHGRLFSIFYPSQTDQCEGGVLVVLPFAEEMNKSRLTISRQAMDLAKNGYGVLILDCFGTGDSEGDFCDARLDIWQADIAVGLAWLNSNVGNNLSIIGVRFGCLLAASILESCELTINKFIMWQPVHGGPEIFRQIDRLKFTRDHLIGDSNEAFLETKNGVEVAGYFIHSELRTQIEKMHIKSYHFLKVGAVHLFQISPFSDEIISSKNSNFVEMLTDDFVDCSFTHVKESQFWASVETELAESLINETTMCFRKSNKSCG